MLGAREFPAPWWKPQPMCVVFFSCEALRPKMGGVRMRLDPTLVAVLRFSYFIFL